MKIQMTIKTPSRFYAEKSGDISVVKDISNWMLRVLDKLPDEIDGARMYDWNHINIVITRES